MQPPGAPPPPPPAVSQRGLEGVLLAAGPGEGGALLADGDWLLLSASHSNAGPRRHFNHGCCGAASSSRCAGLLIPAARLSWRSHICMYMRPHAYVPPNIHVPACRRIQQPRVVPGKEPQEMNQLFTVGRTCERQPVQTGSLSNNYDCCSFPIKPPQVWVALAISTSKTAKSSEHFISLKKQHNK